jgi:hypothetical protein
MRLERERGCRGEFATRWGQVKAISFENDEEDATVERKSVPPNARLLRSTSQLNDQRRAVSSCARPASGWCQSICAAYPERELAEAVADGPGDTGVRLRSVCNWREEDATV